MAVFATYAVEVQLAGSAGAWSAITSKVTSDPGISIRRGIRGPFDRIAAVGEMTLQLNNKNKDFSPDATSSACSGFDIGTPIRCTATFGGGTCPLFVGKLVDIIPMPGTRLGRRTSIIAYDNIDQLTKHKINHLALQVNQRSDQVIAAVLTNVFTADNSVVNIPGGSSLATGDDTYAFAVDTWRDEQTTGWDAIADVTRSEWGTFHCTGSGMLVFKNRHYRPSIGAANLTVSSSMVELAVDRARNDMANQVEIQVTPRQTGSASSAMWTLTDKPSIAAGGSAVFRAPYTDVSLQAARVGGASMIAPVATTDYTMNSASDGSGTNMTGNMTVSASFGANSADIGASNSGATAGYVTLLKIRGTPLLTYQTVAIRAVSPCSQNSYGILELRLSMPIQDQASVAADFSNWLLTQLKNPLTRIRSIAVIANRTTALMNAALQLDTDSKITVTEGQTGLSSANFYVEAIEHQITQAGKMHRTRWLVSPGERLGNWFLGTAGASEVGSTTVLGY